ncbi:hypothetical protein ACIP88_05085 [Streptomyces uncialis]|uniref:hypothetical protein n=1 Tax=Streptomyces uncialis TaxID=1048205 RepID=UPI00380D0989
MDFIDAHGDIWTGDLGGKITTTAEKSAYWRKPEMYYSAVQTLCGPLVPVNPYAADGTRRAIRAELAIVLMELASDAYSDYRSRDDEDATIAYRVHELFDAKARELRDEVGL